MVTLKLNGPRRRESDRVKQRPETNSPIEQEPSTSEQIDRATRRQSTKSTSKHTSPSSANLTPVQMRSASSSTVSEASPPGDTIQVKQRVPSVQIRNEDQHSPEVGPLYAHGRVMSQASGKQPVSNPAAISNGKAPLKDSANRVPDIRMLDAEDKVVEYDFRHDADHGEDEDDGRDTMWYRRSNKTIEDVITISSDDDREDRNADWDLTSRPWKDFDMNMRRDWELMYCHVTDYPMNGDWSTTEDYQHEKDKEMLRYMEDFPLPDWVVPQHMVNDAYNRLVERSRWRSLGIRIYGRERVPEWIPRGAQPQSQPMQRPMPPPTQIHYPSQAMPPQMQNRLSNGHTPSGMPSGLPSGMPQPPPNQMLRSQPTAQPVPTQPNGMPIPSPTHRPNVPGVAPSAAIPNTPMQPQTPVYTPQILQGPSAYVPKRRGRTKKLDSEDAEAPVPPRIPPYEKREKPPNHRTVVKASRNRKRHAEAAEFPWNRDMNFPEAFQNATWDDSIYDPATLANMAEVRKSNEKIIERIDQAESERQRKYRPEGRYRQKYVDELGATRSRKKGARADASSDTEQVDPNRRRRSAPKTDTATGDPYHSGAFEFLPRDQPKALALGKKGPDEIMLEVDEGRMSIEDCADLMICWNPGKKSLLAELRQARFSIKDTLLTRQQLEHSPILVKRAAECIVDFCPDMLWRGMLLRIPSEAGYGNKWIRDRMCLNGNYCDKATITKRIGSALGQKQQQSAAKRAKNQVEPAGSIPEDGPSEEKIKGYGKGEDEYYNENVEDFGHYVNYFGHRTSHRSQLQLGSMKRKASALEEGDHTGSVRPQRDVRGARKHSSLAEEARPSSDAMEISDAETSEGEGDESASEPEISGDAVSVQSDTILDQMDED